MVAIDGLDTPITAVDPIQAAQREGDGPLNVGIAAARA